MSYRWNSNSNSHPNHYHHHHHAVAHQAETVLSYGADRHPPKRMDKQFSGGYGYTVREPPQVRNPDLMMLVANDMEYNNWEQPQYHSNRQDRVTSSFKRRNGPAFEVSYNASRARVSSGEDMVDAEADEFIKFEHRKFEQDSWVGSGRAG